ncbi:hypothetical protein GCM10009558_100400 [Virgisporangium aurantiacum]
MRRSHVTDFLLRATTGLVIAGGATAVTTLRGTGSPTPDASQDVAGPTASASTPPVRRPPIATAPAAPPARCELSKLPMPAGTGKAIVTGADPTGRIIVGRSYLGDGDKQALMWRDGKVQKLPLIGSEPSLNDVTTAGTAVGFEYGPGEEGQFPVVYRDGTVKRLAGGKGEARGINEAGAIAGVLGDDRSSALPARWAGPDSQPERLPLPERYSTGRAQDIDEDGTIVGYLGDQQAPYVWFPDGEHRPLPLPTVDGKTADGGDVTAVRNGWAIGMVHVGFDTRAVRWNVYTGAATVFPEFNIRASAVNARGWVTGPAHDASGLLRTETGTVALAGLPQKNGGNVLGVIPNTLSDDGRTIAGQSDDNTETLRAVVWKCT